jgi:DNA-binding response OmpR family regulator
MLTAKGGEDDKVKGFSYGADDYLVKPFSLSELLARIKAILRRSDYSAAKAEVLFYQNGKIRVFPAEMKVLLDQEDATLTKTEFDILYVLLKNPGQVFSRDKLAEKVMGLDFKGFDRTIDAHIKNIRKKLQLDKNQFIITVYGAGYKFEGEKDE